MICLTLRVLRLELHPKPDGEMSLSFRHAWKDADWGPPSFPQMCWRMAGAAAGRQSQPAPAAAPPRSPSPRRGRDARRRRFKGVCGLRPSVALLGQGAKPLGCQHLPASASALRSAGFVDASLAQNPGPAIDSQGERRSFRFSIQHLKH